MLDDGDVARLGAGDIVVVDGFLGRRRALACARAARELDEAGRLTPAALGRQRVHEPDLRGDRTAWFLELELPEPLRALWEEFEGLRTALNEDLWLGLMRFELQLACYPGDGARYTRHRDAFAVDPARRVTAICYLNEGWHPDRGGQLRAYTPRGPLDVEPVLDRLVLFLSEKVEHEVLPVHAPRLAATAWYRGAEPLPLLPDPSRS